MKDGRKRAWVGPVVSAATVLLLVVVLYVLSMGPAIRLTHRGGVLSKEAFETIYAPVIWIMASGTPPGDWLSQYMLWWLPPDANPMGRLPAGT